MKNVAGDGECCRWRDKGELEKKKKKKIKERNQQMCA
jgi:hypothetical protein